MTPNKSIVAFLVLAGLLFLPGATAQGMIDGITGPNFTINARDGYISGGDGSYLYVWGFAAGDTMQYPGPTLKVTRGDVVTVDLRNFLPAPISMIFPGQEDVTSVGPDFITAGDTTTTITYTFTATNSGTFMYQSGVDMSLQVEMGLFGALIVYPGSSVLPGEDLNYDHEYLFLESEIDPIIHEMVETGRVAEVDFRQYFPAYWFLNGRNAPDTMLPPYIGWMPNQPYNCMPMMNPGDRMLMRFINAGRDLHPFHTHGNNFDVVAIDGRLLTTDPTLGADLAFSDFTHTVPPSGTADAIFTWTGEKLGWDMYGHAPGDSLEPGEYAPDHGKPLPVALPDYRVLTFGAMYSGSPFLGHLGYIPPGSCNINTTGAYTYMWHSHKEKEMTTNNVFPGGMMTMLMIQPPDVPVGGMMGPAFICP